MRKKVILTFLLSTIFTVFFCKGVFATIYSNKFISIDIPNNMEKSCSDSDENSIFEAFARYSDNGSVELHYNVYEREQYYITEFTQTELDQYARDIEEIFTIGDNTCKCYRKELIELNGCKGFRIIYKWYISSINETSYVEEYQFLTDNYQYILYLRSSSKAYLDSTEAREIIKSFKFKDTVKLSRGIPFVDVPSNSWYESAVKYVENNNIIKGTNDYTFSPTQKLTRGMLVTILHRMDGMPKVSGNSSFSDVQNSSAYYYEAVKWAAKNNVVSGYSNGRFGPNDPITREQLAVMLNNYCKYKGKIKTVNGNLNAFKDSNKISSYAKNAMNWAVGNGVITGSNGNVNPKGNATRAEAASMIYKYCLKFGK